MKINNVLFIIMHFCFYNKEEIQIIINNVNCEILKYILPNEKSEKKIRIKILSYLELKKI